MLVSAEEPLSGTAFLWRQFSNVYAANAGQLWSELFVDGINCFPVRWECVPARRWTHVLVQSREAVAARVFVMADAQVSVAAPC